MKHDISDTRYATDATLLIPFVSNAPEVCVTLHKVKGACLLRDRSFHIGSPVQCKLALLDDMVKLMLTCSLVVFQMDTWCVAVVYVAG